jgi:glycosyltransferase involved in cell wall biosynthesis
MRVVIVGGSLPYPPTSGNRIRTLNLTVRLAGRHQVDYLCNRHPDPEETRRAIEHLGDHGVRTIAVDHAVPPKSGPRFYARLAANLASPLPYSVASQNTAALARAIRDHAARHEVDLWQAEWTAAIALLRGLPGARLIVAHNVESQIWRRYYETETNPARRWYIGQQWRKFERFERRALAEADRVVAVSDEDAALIRGHFGVEAVDVVDNGVDVAAFGSVARAPEPGRILFLGSLDWRPNVDAAGLLLDRIFPEVRAAEPSARLDLVGRRPPEALARKARATPGVELHADVPDVRPYLARAAAMAVPLRIGGGSRLKILEALAAGVPVVSTAVGAEGLRLEPGRDLVVVDEVEAMPAALLGCLRDPQGARAMAERGRRVAIERYDWDVLADALERSWGRCPRPQAAGAAPRAD